MTETRPLLVTVPGATLRRALEQTAGGVPDGVELVEWDLAGPPPEAASGRRIDIVVPPYMGASARFGALDGVEVGLVQSQSIGYDDVPGALPPGHVFANAASVHETSTAELAVGLAIAAQRHIDAFAVDTAAGRWAPVFAQSLADRRVLLLGYGGVGKAVAARLAPFEVELTPVASRARDEDGVAVHGIDELPALLPHAEIVVLTLPGGDATKNLVDDAFLSALPDGALVINVGRGSLIDTEALVDHVGRGRIRAALDVTDPEPLPEGHALWSLPGVLITPHVGGASSAMRPRVAKLVRTQIERLVAGEPPLNVVLGG
jgi:phosphoglycerate dehydrogenase-like enzyme